MFFEKWQVSLSIVCYNMILIFNVLSHKFSRFCPWSCTGQDGWWISAQEEKQAVNKEKNKISAAARTTDTHEVALLSTAKNKCIGFATTCASFLDTMKDVADAKKHLCSLKQDFFLIVGGRNAGNNKPKRYKAAQEEEDAKYNSYQ